MYWKGKAIETVYHLPTKCLNKPLPLRKCCFFEKYFPLGKIIYNIKSLIKKKKDGRITDYELRCQCYVWISVSVRTILFCLTRASHSIGSKMSSQ